MKQRTNPNSEALTGKYIRRYDIELLPKTIYVTDVFLDEKDNKVKIKFTTESSEAEVNVLNYLTNYVRTEHEKLKIIYRDRYSLGR